MTNKNKKSTAAGYMVSSSNVRLPGHQVSSSTSLPKGESVKIYSRNVYDGAVKAAMSVHKKLK